VLEYVPPPVSLYVVSPSCFCKHSLFSCMRFRVRWGIFRLPSSRQANRQADLRIEVLLQEAARNRHHSIPTALGPGYQANHEI